MPELPEVETTLRGIKSHIIHQKIVDIVIRHPHLRWPIPPQLKAELLHQTVQRLYRRGKYILFEFKSGTLILHLGMSGRLRILSAKEPPQKHDHIDICFDNKKTLRFTDPRRFGALLWTRESIDEHPLLKDIGREPLTATFNGQYLYEHARGRKSAVKTYIMDSKIVAGVGNIYATEALFEARLHPLKAAGNITLAQYEKLADAIKIILKKAIKKGGTTLKDFMKSDGSPGYFSIELKAYGHAGEPCPRCQTALKLTRIGQRSTVFCPKCQR